MKNNGKLRKKLIVLFGGMYVMWAVMSGTGILNSAAEVKAAEANLVTQTADKSTVSDITIDGDLSEWEAMESFAVSESGVSEWKMTMSEDKSMLYFCFGGTAVSEWDQNYIWKLFTIKYDNGTNLYCQINNLSTAWILPGAEIKMYSNAHGTNPGNYGVECALPVSEGTFSVTFAGTTVSSANIPEFVKAEVKEPVYEGIVIDGDYDDWDAIAKNDAKCPNKDHSWECLSSTACIIDGDYIYIYIKDGATGSAAGAGLYSNGRYSIVTDLGRSLVFQISSANGGMINGIEGATAAYFGNEWEAAIPVSALPEWKNSISFGLYQSEPFVSGVMDFNGGNSGIVGSNGIVYDGLYGDWATYPHTLIQYATAGTQTNDPDGEGALCHDGSIVFGHVVSSMDAHLAEKGGEFSSAISICFNGDREYNGDMTWNFYPRLVAVADDGTINWSPATKELDEGSYEFYLADARGEYNTNLLTNISDLPEHEKFFGRMTITVEETINETEFYVDLEQVAKFLSYYSDTTVEANDFKLVEAQFGRIGNEFISTAGASAGPYVGVAICMAVSAAVLIKRRHNKVVK